ncbi:MAG: hypothetical protein DMG55_01190, partial [Acidobacteria bacterium]
MTRTQQGSISATETQGFPDKSAVAQLGTSTFRRRFWEIWAPRNLEKNLYAGGWPVTWTQVYDPLGHWWLSTLVAALPIIVLLGLLAGLKVRPHLCAVAGAATAVICAMVVFGMPARLAVSSFFYGSAFGLLKIVWIVIAAVFLYDISV